MMMRDTTLTLWQVRRISEGIKDIRVCAVGDVCVDIYWKADMTKSRLSRETPHYPLPIVEERFSPGAGGNVMQNLRALEPKELLPVSAVGSDWRAVLLKQCFSEQGISTDGLVTRRSGITPGYCKPLRKGISEVVYEDPRLDFENHEALSSEDEEQLIRVLEAAAARADIIAVSDQFEFGIVTPRVRDRLAELAGRLPVIVDSRERADLFPGCIIKPNEVEAARILGLNPDRERSLDDYCDMAERLREKTEKPVIITLGALGSLWCDGSNLFQAPTVPADEPTDIVGAGDTFLAAFCCAYAVCQDGGAAMAYANLASGITVKKIGTTGTASRDEILKKWEENYDVL